MRSFVADETTNVNKRRTLSTNLLCMLCSTPCAARLWQPSSLEEDLPRWTKDNEQRCGLPISVPVFCEQCNSNGPRLRTVAGLFEILLFQPLRTTRPSDYCTLLLCGLTGFICVFCVTTGNSTSNFSSCFGSPNCWYYVGFKKVFWNACSFAGAFRKMICLNIWRGAIVHGWHQWALSSGHPCTKVIVSLCEFCEWRFLNT